MNHGLLETTISERQVPQNEGPKAYPKYINHEVDYNMQNPESCTSATTSTPTPQMFNPETENAGPLT